MFRIETERLVIRPWEPQDRDGFRALAQNPVVMRYITNGVPLTEEQIDAALARQAAHLETLGHCMGALIEKATGRLVGTVGAQPLGTTGELELGWWLDPAVWGRGYATEAVGAVLRFVFDTLGRDCALAIIDPPNEASKRVAERIGMRLVGRVTGEELGHRLPGIVVDLYRLDRKS